MHWENETPDCPELPETDIPAELLDGLERLSADGDLLKARLRWRPHLTAATGFLTKNRLLQLRGEPVLEVARALASLATQLHDEGGCEPKFEAQVQRELETPGPEGAREWRSITFYVNQPQPDRSDDVRDDDPYEPTLQSPSWTSPSPAAPSIADYSQYAEFVQLSRTDPTAFAMIVMQQSNDRAVSILERLLMSSVARLDRVLGTQISNSRYLNEALQTLTKGASEVAGLGVNLFNQGLEGQARVARMEHETELGKERTELMRDAVKHGSLLIQAVLMSQQAKQQRAASASAPAAASSPPPQAGSASADPRAASPPSAPFPAAEPSAAPSSADAEIEAKARRVLELVTDDVLDELRTVAPSLPDLFDALRAQPLTADRVRAVIREAQSTVDPVELGLASRQFEPELAHAFGTLVMRVLSEDRE